MNNTQTTTQTLSDLLIDWRTHVNQKLKQWLPLANTSPHQLHQAMQYAVLGGGKRLRPLLVYASGSCFNAKHNNLDAPAVAIELIHCYSLVHDDLPSMDDDDLRRGQATCHKAFDRATAILAGDALQSLAFEILTLHSKNIANELRLKMINVLTKASGSLGMAGGQALDLAAENKTLTKQQLENIHKLKTGALIKASIQLGALTAGCDDSKILNLIDAFAEKIGLAFQIQDDILDIEGTTQTLGKQAGADNTQHKATYPALFGLEESKKLLQETHQQALNYLDTIDVDMSLLKEMSYLLIHRDY